MSLSTLGLSSTPVAKAAAGFLAWNWFYAYALLSTRGLKNRLGIDNNVAPREDATKYGEQAVRDGKITSADLAKLKRNEAAHANSVEGFTLFAASVLFALHTKVDGGIIKNACVTYTAARLVYGPEYIYTTSLKWSWLRTLAWWTGNISCLALFYHGSKA